MSGNNIIIYPGEAEKIVESLKPMLPEQITSPEWYKQQEYIDQLNIQAVLSATNQSDEFIKEFLITHQKLDILVECLVCLEIWIDQVFGKLVKEKFDKLDQSFGLYTILYQEATLVNLLETVLYHADAMESVEAGLMDLFDYCYRRLVELSVLAENKEARRQIYATKSGKDNVAATNTSSKKDNESLIDDLAKQSRVLRFEISLKCVSIMHYFIDHMHSLPLAIPGRLFVSCDIPGLLVGLIQRPPWVLDLEDGRVVKFLDNKWEVQRNWIEAQSQLCKLEGQLWLSIHQMVMSELARDRYELNSHRRGLLLSLRSRLTEPLLERLPLLAGLRRFLEELSISDNAPARPGLILEQVAQFRDSILNEYADRWPGLAADLIVYLASPRCQVDMKQQAAAWARTYSSDSVCVDLLLAGDDQTQPSGQQQCCVVCGFAATKRCSRCHSEWYCRRECQVQHWKKHKPACDLLLTTAAK